MKEAMDTLNDLLEEAKRRTILVAILVLSLAYMMSLTSSSVWINTPIAIIVLAALRRLSFEVEIRWKPRTSEGAPPHLQHLHRRQLTNDDPLLSGPSDVAANRWRHGFDSPVVEAAVDELTRCVIDEWVTNLWYSSITPDQEAPEELRILINGVIAEIAQRAKRVNLITLLSRDMVDLVATHFELYLRMKSKIGYDRISSLSTEERDEKLKSSMMSSRELHPALISPEAEYKVLKKLTGGLVALVLKRQDAHCRVLRTVTRELLACALLRPVLNFASPGFINESIESLAIAANERARQASEEAAEAARQRVPDRVLQRKPSLLGLEMTALGTPESTGGVTENFLSQNDYGDLGTSKEAHQAKGSELMGFDDQGEWGPTLRGDWAQVLDAVTQRREQALTPEHLDNLWTKGRNYKKLESEKVATVGVPPQITKDRAGKAITAISTEAKVSIKPAASGKEVVTTTDLVMLPATSPTTVGTTKSEPQEEDNSASKQYRALLFGDPKEDLPGIGFSPHRRSPHLPDDASSTSQVHRRKSPELVKSRSIEDLLDLSRISQLTCGQTSDTSKSFVKSGLVSQRMRRPVQLLSHRKSRSMGGGLDGWQELGGGSIQGLVPLLNAGEGPSGDDTMLEQKHARSAEKPQSEEASPPSARAETVVLAAESTPHSTVQCRVMGAHFEKSGSKPFAVYTIRVRDADNRSWRVQRRFRNFEQLHRRLKDMPYYALSLPPKRFLASSLDNNFVRERCILLDKYLKDLLAIPSIAELHEVWDFLSVNSQHYAFGISPSIMKTLAVNVDDAMDDMIRQIRGVSDDISGALKIATSGIRQRFPIGSTDVCQTVVISGQTTTTSLTTPGSSSTPNLSGPSPTPFLADSEFNERALGNSVSEDEYGGAYGGHLEESAQGFGSVEWHSDSDVAGDNDSVKTAAHAFASGHLDVRDHRHFGRRLERDLSDGHSPVESFVSDMVEDELVIPQEWSPPKVSVPLLNLVDLVFQLQGRGWIRRQVLWMAKQILQLGMGDAIDDWLIGKIQWLRGEEVVASGILWVKGVLWPDGIFITKHPKNLSPATSGGLEESSVEAGDERQQGQHPQQRPPMNSFEQRREAARRAGVVREIILDKAPAPLVSLIGKRQYTRCAKDIYYFSQSTVCVKQLAFSLLEMLLLAAFPELHDLILDVRSGVA